MPDLLKRALALLMLLIVALMPCLAQAAGTEEELDAAIDKALKRKNATGAAVLVAKDGRVVYEHYYGYAIRSQEVPVTADTWFRVASVTKMISAIGVMTLVEEGKLELDRDISDYLGYKVRNTRFKKDDTPITLRMIMSHTSSLYDGGGYSSGKTSLQYLLDAKNKRFSNFTKKKPGVAYRYSNLNGGMLGVMMELVTGQGVTSVMRERVFEPLGLAATLDVAEIPDQEHVSYSYDKDKKLFQGLQTVLKLRYDDVADPDTHFRITAAKLWIKAPDLLKLGMLLEQGGTFNGITILQPETVAEMMSSQEGKGGISCDSPYGLNINRMTNLVKGHMIYGHQGMSAGMLANLYFDPETHFVFAFISNGINNAMQDHIAAASRDVFTLTWNYFVEE